MSMYESPSITTSLGLTCPFWHDGGGVMTGSVEAPSAPMTDGLMAALETGGPASWPGCGPSPPVGGGLMGSLETGALASWPGCGPSLPELDPEDPEDPGPDDPDEPPEDV